MKKKEKKIKLKLGPVGAVVLMVLVVGCVFVSIGLASKGAELLKFEEMISEVNTKNREIRMEMIDESSLNNIAEKAERLGMMRPEKVVYIGQGNGSRSSLARAE